MAEVKYLHASCRLQRLLNSLNTSVSDVPPRSEYTSSPYAYLLDVSLKIGEAPRQVISFNLKLLPTLLGENFLRQILFSNSSNNGYFRTARDKD